MENPGKKRKPDEESDLSASLQGKVFAQFLSRDGEKTGPQCELPLDITTEQLEILLNKVLLKNEESMPYSFYVDDVEILESLKKAITESKADTEAAIKIIYQPQAIFRVRPVTRCTGSMAGHSAPVITMQFSPDSNQLVSGAGDSTVRFWDLDTSTPLFECKGHKQWITCVAWAPDMSLVASGGYDGMLFLWVPGTGEKKTSFIAHTKWITAVAWQPLHVEGECRKIATASKDASVKIWDIATGRCMIVLSGHTMSVTCLRWGGDGLIYTGSQDRTVKVYAAEEGKLVRTLEGHGHWVNTMALNTDFALRTGAIDHTSAVTEDKKQAQSKALKRYEAVKGGRSERLITGSDDFTMFLWEPSASKKPLARMTGHQQLVNQVVFSPDGRYIASASFDKSVKLWDGFTGKFIATFRGHVGAVYQVAWSADSRMLCSGSKDSTLKLWNLRTRKLDVDLPGHADEVYTVDWSPDGQRVGSGGKDHILKMWHH